MSGMTEQKMESAQKRQVISREKTVWRHQVWAIGHLFQKIRITYLMPVHFKQDSVDHSVEKSMIGFRLDGYPFACRSAGRGEMRLDLDLPETLRAAVRMS